jgi:serine protease
MRNVIIFVIIMSGLILSSSCLAANDDSWPIVSSPNGARYAADRFIVTIRQGVAPLIIGNSFNGIAVTGVASIDKLCSQFDITSVERFYNAPVRKPVLRELISRMYVFHIPLNEDVNNVKDAFSTLPDVETSDLYDIPIPFYTPNDPSINQQWFLNKTRTYEGWDILRGDTTRVAVIGIVDTGVYWVHPDLAANMWVNEREDLDHNGTLDSLDINGIDDDSNGYVDDVIGWDLYNNDNDPREDTPYHGTQVAGCASEATDNGIGGAGIGFSARLMAVKCGGSDGTILYAYQGMVYAADNDANVINCSWGSPQYSNANRNIIVAICNAGSVIVSGAGNQSDSVPMYPAAYPCVIAVAATDSLDHLTDFSNFGSWVDVCAPGDGIYTTFGQNSYSSFYGTSESGPITAGLIALIKAQNPNCSESLTAQILINSCDNIDTLNPGRDCGAGRINAYRALSSHYIPGDINNNGVFNGIDLLYGVNYLRGRGNPPPYFNNCLPHLNGLYPAADINADCVFNGLDITYGVNYLKGSGPVPGSCVDCPSGCQ